MSIVRKESVFNKSYSLVIDSVVALLSKFTEQVNDKALYFVATKKRHQNGTDKCNHCSKLIRFTVSLLQTTFFVGCQVPQ